MNGEKMPDRITDGPEFEPELPLAEDEDDAYEADKATATAGDMERDQRAVGPLLSDRVEQTQTDPFLAMVERVAQNPEVDVSKVEAILSMQERVLEREARNEFYAALNRVQAHMPAIAKDARNDQTQSMYARYETISRALTPVAAAEGFSTSFSQDKADLDGYIRIRGTLRHTAGHAEDHYYVDVPLDDRGIKGTPNKTPTHATGSSFKYGQRYLKCLMFDVAAGDDDDGNQGRPATLSEDQQIVIGDLIGEYYTTEKGREKFFKWLEVENVEAIPAKRYNEVKRELERLIAERDKK